MLLHLSRAGAVTELEIFVTKKRKMIAPTLPTMHRYVIVIVYALARARNPVQLDVHHAVGYST